MMLNLRKHIYYFERNAFIPNGKLYYAHDIFIYDYTFVSLMPFFAKQRECKKVRKRKWSFQK